MSTLAEDLSMRRASRDRSISCLRRLGGAPGLLLVGAAVLTGCASVPAEQPVYYDCASGSPIMAVYRGTDTAVVEMASRVYAMQAVSTPLGRAYAGDGLHWIVWRGRDGPTGTLFTDGANKEPGRIVERCTEIERE